MLSRNHVGSTSDVSGLLFGDCSLIKLQLYFRLRSFCAKSKLMLEWEVRDLTETRAKLDSYKSGVKHVQTWLARAEMEEAREKLPLNSTASDVKVNYRLYFESYNSINSLNDQARLSRLRGHLHGFYACAAVLEDVNLQASVLTLREVELHILESLTERWKEAIRQTSARYNHAFEQLLPLTSFSDRCNEWLLFVTQAQAKLTAPLSASHDELSEQSRLAPDLLFSLSRFVTVTFQDDRSLPH